MTPPLIQLFGGSCNVLIENNNSSRSLCHPCRVKAHPSANECRDHSVGRANPHVGLLGTWCCLFGREGGREREGGGERERQKGRGRETEEAVLRFLHPSVHRLSVMEEREHGGGGGYHRPAKRQRIEEEAGGEELEDGEEEDSAGEEAAGSGGTGSRWRRSGGKVGAVSVSPVCASISHVTKLTCFHSQVWKQDVTGETAA